MCGVCVLCADQEGSRLTLQVALAIEQVARRKAQGARPQASFLQHYRTHDARVMNDVHYTIPSQIRIRD